MAASISVLRPKTIRLLLLLIFSWCIMLLTHEIGHILGGWLSGATLKDYDLRPWRLPYSIHAPDPNPLITLWAGPLFGVVAPLVIAMFIRRPSVRLVAYFCTIANGTYLAVGWITGDRFLDPTMMLDKGTHPLWLAFFCIITIPIGYVGLRKACLELLAPRPSKVAGVSNDE